jgi:hypothetical protein
MAHLINSKILARFILPIFVLMVLLYTAPASGNGISELRERIFSFEDSKITVQDLAFYLVTHNYDAVPGDGYVELQLDGKTYRLVPNGNAPGVCDVSPLNEPQK